MTFTQINDIKAFKTIHNRKNISKNFKHLSAAHQGWMIDGDVIADSCKNTHLYALEQLFYPHYVTLTSKFC